MGFGKWQISITNLLISGLYLGNVHIQIYHKASPDQEKESHDTVAFGSKHKFVKDLIKESHYYTIFG